jgi:4-amino-4-deoxy-L-arabinose transferase-like glycosyltransferase
VNAASENDRAAPVAEKPLLVYVLIVLGVLGLLARLLIAATWIGSQDVVDWEHFGRFVRQHGVLSPLDPAQRAAVMAVGGGNAPGAVAGARHDTPLAGIVCATVSWFCDTSGVPFHFAIKLPPILADVLSALLLYRLARERAGVRAAAVAFAIAGLSPILMVVSGFDGNPDSVYAFCALLAASLVERGKAAGAGLALGVGLNAKLIPLYVLPAIGVRLRDRRDLGRFACGLAAGLAPFLPPFLLYGRPFVSSLLGYNAVPDRWGLILFLGEASHSNPLLLEPARAAMAFYRPAGRWIVLVAILLLVALGRKARAVSTYRLAAASFATFLVLVPGFATHYLVAVVPLLIAVEPGTAALYSVLAGATAAITHASFMTPSGVSVHTAWMPLPAPLFGLLAWAVLVGFVARTVGLAVRSGTGTGSGSGSEVLVGEEQT